ncbi:MAG: VapE family protein [Raineya sp.]
MGIKKNDIFSVTERYLSSKYEFRRNTVSFEIEYKPKYENTQWGVINPSSMYRELHKNGIFISEAKLKALLRSNWVVDYNPFLAYFEGLPPPTENKDYITELASYVLLSDWDSTLDFAKELKKALIRCVACSLGQAFNKQCFVLVSPKQNIGKTSFIKYLCPPQLQSYYTEEMSFDKDGLIALSSNFIINLDELSVIAKSDLNTLKTYFSKDTIKVRLPYEAKASTVKRVCNFFASTNNEDFLNDPTGSVRWIAFYIEGINFEYSKINIDHVWWQAYQLFKAGETGKMTQKDIEANEKRNQQFTKVTPEMEYIAKYFEPDPDKIHFFTATEIAEYLQTQVSNRISVAQVGKALQTLKYERVSSRFSKKAFPEYGYFIKKVFTQT